jgi:hypothetical protein
VTLFAIIVGGVAILGGFFVGLMKKQSYDEGVLRERNDETTRSDAAKARADDVLAERLRRGDF